MTLIVPVLDSIGNGTRLTLAGSDDLYLGAGLQLISTDSSVAVFSSATANDLQIAGRMSSAGTALMVTGGATITLESTALLSGATALHLARSAFINNAGSILGGSIGVVFHMMTAEQFDIDNSGTIVAAQSAFSFGSQLSGSSSSVNVHNTGSIRGGVSAFDFSAAGADHDLTVRNSGSITGQLLFGAGEDALFNSGRIRGTVNMGGGNDSVTVSALGETIEGGAGNDSISYRDLGALTLTLDANGATGAALGDLITGFETVVGSLTGSDAITGNAAHNVLNGEGGNDTLSGLLGNDTLVGAAGNDLLIGGIGNDSLIGGAGNDVYSFENAGDVIVETGGDNGDVVQSSANYFMASGLETGQIVTTLGRSLTGNSLNNRLIGNIGNDTLDGSFGSDTLSGGLGADRLIGGSAVDRLTGSSGADDFRFLLKTDAGDAITDFTSGSDKISVDISAFAVVLPLGTLAAGRLQIRADNLAQDADDRFVFRTTDKTLWFDANGSASGGLTLLADRQSSAVLTSADILIF